MRKPRPESLDGLPRATGFKGDGMGFESKWSDPRASAPKHSPAAQHITGAPIAKVPTPLGAYFLGLPRGEVSKEALVKALAGKLGHNRPDEKGQRTSPFSLGN